MRDIKIQEFEDGWRVTTPDGRSIPLSSEDYEMLREGLCSRSRIVAIPGEPPTTLILLNPNRQHAATFLEGGEVGVTHSFNPEDQQGLLAGVYLALGMLKREGA